MLNKLPMRYSLACLAVLGLVLISHNDQTQHVRLTKNTSTPPHRNSVSGPQPTCTHCAKQGVSAKPALRTVRHLPLGLLWEQRSTDPAAAPKSVNIKGDPPLASDYLPGTTQTLLLEDGTLIPVHVIHRHIHLDDTIAIDGLITGKKDVPQGRLHMQWNDSAGFFLGQIEYDQTALAYEIRRNDQGTVSISRHSIDELVCAEVDTSTGVVTYGLPPVPEMAADSVAEASAEAEASSVVPALNSYLSASAVIYLDFDGEQVNGTSWGHKIDATATGFSSSKITDIWERVSADFTPFNINVTTDETVYLNTPANRRIRCIITPSNEWYGSNTAGGVAKYNSFTWSGDTPCWVFSDNLANGTKYIAEACSHEIGHTLGLSHDGKSSTAYYSGHGSGAVGWAPIMGSGYFKPLTQWSKGEYSNATNTQDDLSIITSASNGFGYREDDHADQVSGASVMSPDASQQVSGSGMIERQGDVDVFAIESGAGSISFDIIPSASYGNLDIEAVLYDVDGNLIATANPSTLLNASMNTTVAGGSYFLHIRATGYGTADTGSTDYASLGSYTISGVVAAVPAPTPYELTVAALPENQRNPNDDPDNDGFSNLAEHALGTNPATAEPSHHFLSIQPNGASSIDFLIDLPTDIPTDVIYTVEATCTLDATDWIIIASRTTTGSWGGSAKVTEEIAPNGRLRFRISDTPEGPWTCRFMRLHFALAP